MDKGLEIFFRELKINLTSHHADRAILRAIEATEIELSVDALPAIGPMGGFGEVVTRKTK